MLAAVPNVQDPVREWQDFDFVDSEGIVSLGQVLRH